MKFLDGWLFLKSFKRRIFKNIEIYSKKKFFIF